MPFALEEILAYVASCPFRSELILVNDGSGAATREVLERFASEHPHVIVLRNLPHRGKGASVQAGMLAARGQFRIFLDSDQAYPAAEIDKLLVELENSSEVAIACRVLPASRYVMSPTFFHYLYTRHLMSRFFNFMVRRTLLPGLLDTQAGLKGFTRAAAELIFPQLTIEGFGFDLEILYIARAANLQVTQVPILFRYDEEPSTVRVMKDAAEMLRDILHIRSLGRRGKYQTSLASAETDRARAIPVSADTRL